VYRAERPELFFKADARRVSGPDQPIAVRADSTWNVPEPELALVPDSPFSLQAGDEVEIEIDGLGTLTNPVVEGKSALR
jgi:fumarylacetoacetate (FAA) hydrolase family protein